MAWRCAPVRRRYLPPASLDKSKQGFAIPLDHWFRTDLKDMIADTLESQSFTESGVFDPKVAKAMLAQHLSGEKSHGEKLWQMLVFSLWGAGASRPRRDLDLAS